MSVYSELQVMVTERDSATSTYSLRESFNDLEYDCTEALGFSTYSIEGSSGPTEISLGSLDKGKLLVFSADSELTLHFNASDADSFTGTFFAGVFGDSTGLTSLYVTNDGTEAVIYNVYVAGDVSAT